MSESSEEKSKRKYLNLLCNYQWPYQHSVFYSDLTESTALLGDMIKFKQALRRCCPKQPFLIKIQLLNKKTPHNPEGGQQAYLAIFTTEKTKTAIAFATEKAMRAETNVIYKKLTREKIANIALAINNQKPHNLEKFFKKEKINRYTILNKDHLLPIQEAR
jgi:hypothetical protein